MYKDLLNSKGVLIPKLFYVHVYQIYCKDESAKDIYIGSSVNMSRAMGRHKRRNLVELLLSTDSDSSSDEWEATAINLALAMVAATSAVVGWPPQPRPSLHHDVCVFFKMLVHNLLPEVYDLQAASGSPSSW